MSHDLDLIDQLELYTAKMRQEHESLDDVLEHALEQRAKMSLARKLCYEVEQGRLEFSNALRPFMPELPAPPVQLQSEPANVNTNGHHYADPFEDLVEPAVMPQFMRGRG